MSEKIERVLEACEQTIRSLIATAAQAGDYSSVDRGREVAIQIHGLRQKESGGSCSVPRTAAPRVTSSPDTSKSKRKRTAKVSGYPRFEVRENSLIRYGWSKKEKREYSHKVPKEAFDHILEVMSELGATDPGPHMAEAIIERANGGVDEPIPNYQVYAILGFLKNEDNIEQRGREGYLVPSDFRKKAHASWK